MFAGFPQQLFKGIFGTSPTPQHGTHFRILGLGEMKNFLQTYFFLYIPSQLIAWSVSQTGNLRCLPPVVTNSCPLPTKCFSNLTRMHHFRVTYLVQALYLQTKECGSLWTGLPSSSPSSITSPSLARKPLLVNLWLQTKSKSSQSAINSVWPFSVTLRSPAAHGPWPLPYPTSVPLNIQGMSSAF